MWVAPFHQNNAKFEFCPTFWQNIAKNPIFICGGRSFCENNRRYYFFLEKIGFSIIFTKRTLPHMKIRSLGKIYQNAPMPPSQKLKFSIILIKKERTCAYENSILGQNFWKKIGKKLRFSIILMKRSPPHTKIGFLAIFCKVFGKKLDFRLFWWKGVPHTAK